ncbi:hypothetical protein, partial [Pseudomonas proteolytica]|uniref:hypothetical protein n=1 Tax=Pseudomonas proteolytica TaxID=219574 RepID=UPI001CB70094
PAIAVYLKKRGGLVGAASQPSAGQARSPRGASVSECCVDTYAAMAVYQWIDSWLIHRHRGQARTVVFWGGKLFI